MRKSTQKFSPRLICSNSSLIHVLTNRKRPKDWDQSWIREGYAINTKLRQQKRCLRETFQVNSIFRALFLLCSPQNPLRQLSSSTRIVYTSDNLLIHRVFSSWLECFHLAQNSAILPSSLNSFSELSGIIAILLRSFYSVNDYKRRNCKCW